MKYLLLLFFVIYIYRVLSSFNFSEIFRDYTGEGTYGRPKNYETSLLILASKVIKADGIINKKELEYVRNYFVRTYGKEKANNAFRKFKSIVQQRVSTRALCMEICKFMPYPARIKLVSFLFDVANSDGKVSHYEELEIRKIASYLFIRQVDYLQLRSIHYQREQDNDYSTYTYSQKSDYEYEVLELDENASNEEVKKSYRNLAKKYHPDRFQNASETELNIAKEKFQKIQSAYETIKSRRGF